MKTYKLPVLTFTAIETVLGEDAQGNEIETQKTHQFSGVEFPDGVVMVMHAPAAAEFYKDAASVQAVGLAQVTGFVDSGVVEEFDAEEIRAAVEASAREYGKDSIPEAMADWLEETISVSLPDGQTTPRGWHLTWTGASVSSGAAFQKPGFYPADPEAGTADSVVAPIAFVEEWERREDPENQYPDAREEAVRAYARSQGWPCG